MFTIKTVEEQTKNLQPSLKLIKKAVKAFQVEKTKELWLTVQEALDSALICFHQEKSVHHELVNKLLIQFNYCYAEPQFIAVGDHFWEQGDKVKAKECYRQLSELIIKIKEKLNLTETQNRAEDEYSEICRMRICAVSTGGYNGMPDPLVLKQKFAKPKTKLVETRNNFVNLIQEQQFQQAQTEFSDILRNILIELCRQTESELGPAPCESFTVLCLGSLARGEACPYSDLECVIVWKEKPTEKNTDNSLFVLSKDVSVKLDIKPNDLFLINAYFKAFMQLLEFKLFALGETNELCGNEKIDGGLQTVLKSMKRGLRLDEGGNFPFSAKHKDLLSGAGVTDGGGRNAGNSIEKRRFVAGGTMGLKTFIRNAIYGSNQTPRRRPPAQLCGRQTAVWKTQHRLYRQRAAVCPSIHG